MEEEEEEEEEEVHFRASKLPPSKPWDGTIFLVKHFQPDNIANQHNTSLMPQMIIEGAREVLAMEF